MFTYALYTQQNKKAEGVIPGMLTNTVNEAIVTWTKLDENLIEKEINNVRKENGRSELTKYEPLCELANLRVEEIKTDWSHNGFKNRNQEIYTRFCNQNDIICTSAGENLAKGSFKNEKEVAVEWFNSPEHKENMLGEYNVQCVAVSENHFVSLFAYTQDLKVIEQQQKEQLESNVTYDYSKVVFWEEQRSLNTKYLKSWKSGYDNPHYEKKDLDDMINLLEKKQDISDKLWDGYTNSKITNQEAEELETTYWNISAESSKLSKDLNEKAYDNCRYEDIEENICKIYKS